MESENRRMEGEKENGDGAGGRAEQEWENSHSFAFDVMHKKKKTGETEHVFRQ